MAFLTGRIGAVKDRRFELAKDATTIGRRSENDVPIDDASVSGHHGVILREGTRFRLRDLDSTNGTIVNGQRVREILLSPRDTIALGDILMQFDDPDWNEPTPEAEAAARPPPTVGVKPSALRVPESFQNASPFGARHDFSRLWAILIVLAGVIAAITALLFIVSFLRG